MCCFQKRKYTNNLSNKQTKKVYINPSYLYHNSLLTHIIHTLLLVTPILVNYDKHSQDEENKAVSFSLQKNRQNDQNTFYP